MNSGSDDNSVLSQSRDSNSVLHVLPNTTGHDIESLRLGGDEANADLITDRNHGTSSSTGTSILDEFTEENMVIAQDTMKTFPVGTTYDTFDDLLCIVKTFARSKLFTVRKSGNHKIVCSRAQNWNSKLKEDGKRVPKRTGSAVACGCTWMLKCSQSKFTLPKARLTGVQPHHNHQCNLAGAVVSYKKSGKGADELGLIEELGEEGYRKRIDEERRRREPEVAAAEARRAKEQAARNLVKVLEAAADASGSGVADTLEGTTVGKTAARTEWYVKPDELRDIAPVDPSKKLAKYRLADVIRVADGKGEGRSGSGGHIRTRVGGHPDRQKLYARYLHDEFEARAEAVGDDAIVRAAYEKVRSKIESAVKAKAAAAEKARGELMAEETRLAAFDRLVENAKPNGGSKDQEERSSATAKAAAADVSTEEGNIENDAEKPSSVKKRKVNNKSGQSAIGRLRSRRRKIEVSSAEVNGEEEEEG